MEETKERSKMINGISTFVKESYYNSGAHVN